MGARLLKRADASLAFAGPGVETVIAPPELEVALKLESWIVRRPLANALLSKRELVDALAAFATSAAPLLAFGWSALERHPPAVSSGARSR